MPNDSATGGPLVPANVPSPKTGLTLLTFLQAWCVGITGLDGTMIRPRFQTEPPTIPDSGEVWAAIGIASRPADKLPYIAQTAQGSALQRHELLNVMCSFYDTGVSGFADAFAMKLRDGAAIPQNVEVLRQNGMALFSMGDLQDVPSLLKQRWLYRVDLPFVIARQVDRVYPVLTVVSVDGTLVTDNGLSRPINAST